MKKITSYLWNLIFVISKCSLARQNQHATVTHKGVSLWRSEINIFFMAFPGPLC